MNAIQRSRRYAPPCLPTSLPFSFSAPSADGPQDEVDLNTIIQDVELAVQRGRALQEVNGTQGTAGSEGLEVQLRTVAEKVASAGPGGGLLERVKGFNRMVEWAIAVL